MTQVIAGTASLRVADHAALRAAMTQMTDGFRHLRAPPGAWLAMQFVLDVGVDYPTQRLPQRYRRRVPRHCFGNARALVRRSKVLRYCEGFALSPCLAWPFHHAWAVDAAGRVIDPTWNDPDGCAYCGVIFSADEIARYAAGGGQSVLTDDRDCVNVAMIRDKLPDWSTRYPDLIGL